LSQRLALDIEQLIQALRSCPEPSTLSLTFMSILCNVECKLKQGLLRLFIFLRGTTDNYYSDWGCIVNFFFNSGWKNADTAEDWTLFLDLVTQASALDHLAWPYTLKIQVMRALILWLKQTDPCWESRTKITYQFNPQPCHQYFYPLIAKNHRGSLTQGITNRQWM